MARRFARGMVATAVSVALSAACGGDEHGHASTTGGAATACEQDTRKDVYAVGLSKAAQTFTVRVLEAVPAPPEKGKNRLEVEVVDATGAPVDGAVLSVLPFMPDHGHGSATTPTTTPKGNGRYTIDDLVLTMPGLWEVRMTVQSGTSPAEEVRFAFCIEG